MDKIFVNQPDINPLFLADTEDEDNSSELSSEDDGSNSSNKLDKNDSSKSFPSPLLFTLC
jgi:hypothetical protein